MDYHLIIDKREQKIIQWFNNNNIQYKSELLDIGDIHICKGEKTIYIIERKTIQDMNSSIKDGRYKEQKARLLSSLAKNECQSIFYILEGDTSLLNKQEKKIIHGAWISCQFRDNINVIRTISVKETCEFIIRFLNRIQSKETDFIKDNIKQIDIDYLKTIKTKKKTNITPNTCQILALSTIPNISHTIAEKVINHFGSLSQLFNHYECIVDEVEKENTLATIKLNDKRTLGKSASKKIYTYLIKNISINNISINNKDCLDTTS